MSEEETDSNLPENVFLTKLALDILGGRSFDVHGNRQDFEDIVCPQQKAAEDADKIKWKNFIRRMQSMFEIELQRTMKNSANNYNKYMREFREQNPMDGDPDPNLYFKLEKETLQRECKIILAEIQSLRERFKDANRLDQVSGNLHLLMGMFNNENI